MRRLDKEFFCLSILQRIDSCVEQLPAENWCYAAGFSPSNKRSTDRMPGLSRRNRKRKNMSVLVTNTYNSICVGSDFLLYLRLSNVGGIAQLGERLHGMQEVSGSIPLTSTNIDCVPIV